ncbi:conserved membrane hypothetical protein [uncultured delta proteobacterium]|uniref:DUF1538 domain-containing protein n=1 Tax=uncultured delta proteobacterium TaxID=34034 RepID=A0A212K1P8_9DELT|nr:conserved membrane hypothetical protein [uncultured delta proteobacterium]
MIADFVEKFKESTVSVVPIMAIVVLLSLTIAPLGEGQLPQFLAGGVLLILGLSTFLVGAEISMVPFGQRVGSALTRKRSLALMLFASFAIGFAITIAEPDVQVLATQVSDIMPGMDRNMLLMMIAVGVGIFLLVGTGRIVLQIPLRYLLIGFYIALFGMCALVDAGFVGVAFDAGGATTGPITVPFIMAMGVGVAAAGRRKESSDGDDSFGLVGLASIGPIAAVVVFGLTSGSSMAETAGEQGASAVLSVADAFLSVLPHITQEIALALLPLFIIFIIFQVLLLRLPAEQVKRMVFGLIYAYIGLVAFMTGVSGGFSPVGKSLGFALGAYSASVLIPVGFVLGAVVVCAEPAVWILTQQIEEISGGYIQRKIMFAALSISIAVAVVLGMLRVVTGMSIWYVLIPGYALALMLTRFCPPLFTAIAFDSGGVASGPMATTFILSLTLGASAACGGNPATDAFGMIAMIAMAPLITIQILGMIFNQLEKRQKQREAFRKGDKES